MKCENCGKNPATVHTKTVINGHAAEKVLCAQCWAEQNGKFAQPFTLSDLFKGIIQPDQSAGPACPTCQMDLRTFRKSGLLGCPDCYTAFGQALEPNLVKIHGKARHEGKRPLGAKPARVASPQEEDAVSLLRRQLKEAVESEDYERAASLRDKIKEISSVGEGGGNG